MISSNFCHDPGKIWRQRLSVAIAAFAVLRLALPVWAVDPNRTTSQYVREQWGVEQGFPAGPVYSISQTSDGYLWIGTEKGLVRFDGLNFLQMHFATPDRPMLTHVLGLVPDKDGSLWIRLRRPTLLRYHEGGFEDPMERFGFPNGSAAAMSHTWDGALLLWALHGEGRAMVARHGKFETIAVPKGFSRSPVLALTQTQDGEVWVGTRDAGLFRMQGPRVTPVTEGLPDPKVNALALANGKEFWVGTDRGVVRWDGAKLTKAGVPAQLANVEALALESDHDGNLWVGTNSQGLVRVNARGMTSMNDGQGDAQLAVTALFEDREGNLWKGSASGLERIRDSVFVTYSTAEGMPSGMNGPIHSDDQGRLWFAPIEGGLWWMRDGKPERLTVDGLNDDIVYAIAKGRDGLWVGRRQGGLTFLRPNGAGYTGTTWRTRQGLAQDSVYSVYEGEDGTVWAGTLSGGVSRLRDGRFTTYTSENGLGSNTVAAILETSDGAMWFATPRGLSRFQGDVWKTFRAAEGLPSENVNCLFEDSRKVLWVGTANGLASWSGGKMRAVSGAIAGLREQILGLAEDRDGSLWIATSAHVLRVNREKLSQGALTDGDVREFGKADGLRGTEGVKRSRSVISDEEGRIWFSLNHGISVVDSSRLRQSTTPAIVHVQAISVDGNGVELTGPVHVPGGMKRLTLEYAGLSLSVPERVRFRTMLEGFERNWSSPVATRAAVYTNLGPGPYRFRVMASNADGVWSDREAVLAFEVDPLFWQTWWFRAAALAMCGLVGLGLYRLRLRQVTQALNVRFEERLAERTRIAQELHDTLLQGFLSASMQVHVASDGLPAESPAKKTLQRALQLMAQVIDEGRNAVRGLRSSSSSSLDLEQAFAQVQQELGLESKASEAAAFRVIVEGEPRALHPLLRDEVYRIGREALINAFRHSRASHIEIELRYQPGQMLLFVRDDGAGIDAGILQSGRDGHWGLSGMQERANRIGARLQVFSRTAAGTEVELSVPGEVAYRRSK